MPGRLRVFLSSTMEDLENERDMVVAQLEQSNFEPVNAETILPSGATSWERISDEQFDRQVAYRVHLFLVRARSPELGDIEIRRG